MKIRRWTALVLSVILLMGCTVHGESAGQGSDADKGIEGKGVPEEYQPEDAVADGHVVIVHGTMLSDPAILRGFIEETGKGMKKDVTVVQYTVEGDPILTRVSYDGMIYHGVEDNTRDRFGEQGYREFEFRYLKVFEDKGERMVLLVDDETLTFEKYMKSMLSSHSDDMIPHQFLCSYQE